MHSSIYDSIRATNHISEVLFCVKTSTHYHGAVVLTTWLFVYVSILKQSAYNSDLYIYLEINTVCGNGLAMIGGLVMGTV